MTSLKILATIALVLWILWNIAFYAEGNKTQGSRGLKTIGVAAELCIWVLLIWVIVQ